MQGKRGKLMQFIGFIIVLIIIGVAIEIWPVFVVLALIFIAWKMYELFYYKSGKFLQIKDRIESYINDCNELNGHIERLKHTQLVSTQTDYGDALYRDRSKWNYKRKHLNNQEYLPNIHDCSRTVCNNAKKKPFEYICKYFGIKATEENNGIIESIQSEVPLLIRKIGKAKLERELGFDEIDMGTAYFPKYIFKYVSPGGNASTQCDVVMDIDNLNRFVIFLSEKIKFNKSAAGQRALMTSKLRQKIKERDEFTCKNCGASVEKEPNLLLEIDHIVPISKGGLTTEDNLQTLCWRCNRKKGAKII